MGQDKYFTKILMFLCVFSAISAQNVPVLMWNINADDITVNPLQALDSTELVNRVTRSINGKLVVFFLQDELSVEDFKSDGLLAMKTIADMSSGTTFYAPSVSNPENIPNDLEAKGFKLTRVQSHQDLPTEHIKEKTVLVVELPSTGSDSSRNEHLELNVNIIGQVFEVLKSQQEDVIGVFTAKTNLKAPHSHVRVARAADAGTNTTFTEGLIKITTQENIAYLYIEEPPVIKHIENQKNTNFTLAQLPEISQSVIGERESTIVLVYSNIENDEGAKLNRAEIKMEYGEIIGYWEMKRASVLLDITTKENKPLLVNITDMKPGNVLAPLSFSYHCTPKKNLISYDSGNGTFVSKSVVLEMRGFQLQPFGIGSSGRFGDWYDCQGFFTEGIWAGILLGLVIAMMLAWAVGMLADVRTPDRFDDPKGKTITITATD